VVLFLETDGLAVPVITGTSQGSRAREGPPELALHDSTPRTIRPIPRVNPRPFVSRFPSGREDLSPVSITEPEWSNPGSHPDWRYSPPQ
jgi:hypothetical protein